MRKISLLLICLLVISFAKAQNIERPITTGVPFLLVAADARAAGLADQGVATSSDVFLNNGIRQNMPLQKTHKGFLSATHLI